MKNETISALYVFKRDPNSKADRSPMDRQFLGSGMSFIETHITKEWVALIVIVDCRDTVVKVLENVSGSRFLREILTNIACSGDNVTTPVLLHESSEVVSDLTLFLNIDLGISDVFAFMYVGHTFDVPYEEQARQMLNQVPSIHHQYLKDRKIHAWGDTNNHSTEFTPSIPAEEPVMKAPPTLRGRLHIGELLTTQSLLDEYKYIYLTDGTLCVGSVASNDKQSTLVPAGMLLETMATLASCGEYWFREALIMLNDSVAASKWLHKFFTRPDERDKALPEVNDSFLSQILNTQEQTKCVSGSLFGYEINRPKITDTGEYIPARGEYYALGYFSIDPAKIRHLNPLTQDQLIAAVIILSAKP